MARLAIDDAAWTNRWRSRSVAEKALLAGGLMVVALLGPQPLAGCLVAVVALGAALLGARVAPSLVARALRGPVVFVAIGLVGVVVTIGPTASVDVWRWGPLAATPGSLERGIQTAARSAGALCALLLLSTTTPMTDLLAGARRLGVPGVVVDIAGGIYRMLFVLLETQSSLREAQAARLGYDGARAARRSVGLLSAALLVRALDRARRLDEGLLGRGYDGTLDVAAAPVPASRRFVLATAALLLVLGLGCVVAGPLW